MIAFEHRKNVMKLTFVCFVALLFTAGSSNLHPVEMTLSPSRSPQAANKLRLWPEPGKQIAADAVPLYSKAAQSLPNDLNTDQISQWLKSPLDKLPQDQVKSILEQLKPALQLVEQAAECKLCNWPAFTPGTMPANLNEYRTLVRILALKARFEIAQGRCDQAATTIRTGLAAAKHIGESNTLIQGLVGVAIAALTLRQVEEFIQQPSAPNPYNALRDLPKPLVDVNKPIAVETERQLEPAYELARLKMKKLDRQVAALQCVEALKLYAGAHEGKFPNALADVTGVPVPPDPLTGKPFVYIRTGAEAVLKGPAPANGDPKDAIDYRLILKD